jgi:hypothetical protein
MSILRQEKIPYILVLLFAIVAWLITHLADSLTLSPFLEYSIEKTKHKNAFKLTYTITNITKDKNIDEIDFFITPEVNSDSIILYGSSRILPPLKINPGDIDAFGPNSYKQHLSNFQPNCTIIFDIIISKDSILPLRLSSKTPVLLVKSSMMTRCVKYEFYILLILTAFFLTLTVTFLIIAKVKNID